MRILIFGVSSYIGKNLAEALVKEHEVHGTVCHHTTGDDSLNEIRVDFNDPDWVNKLPNMEYDLAIWSAQSPQYSQDLSGYPKLYRINCSAFQEAIDFCHKNNVKQFINLSSGTVYKNLGNNTPFKEADALDEASLYGMSKYISERITSIYSGKGMKTISLRLFAVYGPNQKNKVISNLISKIEKQQRIDLNQTIGMRFSPIFISDLVNIILTLIDNPSIPDFFMANVAGDEVLTLSEICKIASAQLQVPLNIHTADNPAAYSVANTDHLKQHCSYQPNIKIEQGIEQILNASINA